MRNNFPMMQWHVEHMEKTIVKYVKGLSEGASSWERRNHKKYGNLTNACKQIEYDIKHGVTNEQVMAVFQKVRHDAAFSELRKSEGSLGRLDQVEEHFSKPKIRATARW